VATAALGFGAQSIVRDFLAGFFILFEGQFEVGDVIDLGEASGVVESITLRRTQLRGVDGTVWHVSNGVIQRVGNRSQGWSQAVLDLRIAPDEDLKRAQEVMAEAAARFAQEDEWSGVILSPPEVWGVEDIGPEGAIVRLVVKTKPGEQFRLLRALRVSEKGALDEAGIALAPPQPVR
jgi:small conductance mechanosensitive channel